MTTIGEEIKKEKLQYDINREAGKISALSSNEIDKYGYLRGEEILPANQRRTIEQAKLTDSYLGKALEKQTKTMTLTQKQKKYQLYHQIKIINMTILQVKEISLSNERRMIEQRNFIYSLLEKALEKQTKIMKEIL